MGARPRGPLALAARPRGVERMRGVHARQTTRLARDWGLALVGAERAPSGLVTGGGRVPRASALGYGSAARWASCVACEATRRRANAGCTCEANHEVGQGLGPCVSWCGARPFRVSVHELREESLTEERRRRENGNRLSRPECRDDRF